MKTLLLLTALMCCSDALAQSPKFSADMSGDAIVIDPNGFSTDIPTAYGHIKNLTGDSLLVAFIREETLPSLWNTNVCFGVNCYASFVSTQEEYWAPGEEKSLKVIFNTPPSPIGSANVRIKIFTPGGNDTLVFDLSASAAPWLPVECRKLQLYNDSDVDLVIDRIWLSDSINFSIAPRYPLPTEFYAESSMEYELCVIPRNGESYTTKLFYSVGTEVRETSVTLIAPNSASVADKAIVSTGLYPSVIAPLSFVTIPAAVADSREWNATITSIDGSNVVRARIDNANGQCWIPAVSSGMYFVRLLADGVFVATDKLFVK